MAKTGSENERKYVGPPDSESGRVRSRLPRRAVTAGEAHKFHVAAEKDNRRTTRIPSGRNRDDARRTR